MGARQLEMRPIHRRAIGGACFVSVLACTLFGAVTETSAERLPIKAYTTDNGLAHNRVKRIVEDSRGFLWLCTAAGLSRFDGRQFTNYTVDDGLFAPSINDLVESQDGVYWVATNSHGVVRFDVVADTRPATNGATHPRFKLYPISNEPAANRVNVLLKDSRGALWAGTDGGLFRMEEPGGETAFQPVPLGIPSRPDNETQVWALVEDRERTVWVATKFGVVRRDADGHSTHYQIQPSAVDDVVMSMLLDRSGQLWFAHASGLISFDPRAAAASPETDGDHSRPLPAMARHYTTRDGLPHNNVLAVAQSADGQIWVATSGNHVSSFDGRVFRTHRIVHGTSAINFGLTVGRDGNLWLGTDASGALKVTVQGWVSYDDADGLGIPVNGIFVNASGDVYITSRAWRVSRFRNPSFATVRLPLPAHVDETGWRPSTGIIQDRRGEWWVSTRAGLHRFPRVDRFEDLASVRATAVYTTRDGLASNDVTHLFEDSRGDLWIGSFGPAREVLTRWDRASGQFHRYGEPDGLQPFTSAQAFAEDAAGDVWVGFREHGVARYRGGRFTVLGSANGLPVGGVNGIYPDQSGRLWIAVSQGGLCRIDAPTSERPAVVTYSKAAGLTTDIITSVTGDADGRIYVTSSRGIDRFDPSTGTLKRLSAGPGVGGIEFTGSLRDRNGALWFRSTIGLWRFVPQPEARVTPPPTLISAVQVAGSPRPLSALGESTVALGELGGGENNVQIDFFAVEQQQSEALRYQYKLEGTAGDWTAPTPQRAVNYASLAPGAYRFQVRAINADSEAGEPATVAFEILPPLWARWWFLAAVASVATAVVAGAARARYTRLMALRKADEAVRRSREERLAELERVRKRIATDLHDEIGSSLTRISLLSEVVRQRLGSGEHLLAEPLSSIAGLSRELVDAMSDIVWAINPKKDHLSDLSQRMRHFASDVLTARQIAFRFRTPDAEHDIPIGANVRRELFMIFKEAVNNLVKHSSCTEAHLELRLEKNELVLRVQDNGRGFDSAAARNGGHGLESMRERTEALGGTADMVSKPGAGTSLTFVIPLSETPSPPLAAPHPT